MNIAQRLAERVSGKPALLCAGKVYSFHDIELACARLAGGLAERGVTKGTRVSVLVAPGFEFAVTVFAVMRLGAVPVLIDPGIGFKNLGECLESAAPEVFIGSDAAQLARVLGRWASQSIRMRVTTGLWPGAVSWERLFRGQPHPVEAVSREDIAAILFTSGSTGTPKGVVYTHGMFNAQLEMLQAMFAIKEGEVSVATFPLFALFDVCLGMTVVIPDMDASRPASVNPEQIISPMRKYGAAQLFGSPALLDRLSRAQAKLPSVKRVISAGAPMHRKILERMRKMLPQGAQVWTPYGATESLPVALIGSDELLGLDAVGQGVCVGRPVAGVEVRIIKITDEPIARWSEALRVKDGEIGEIAVRSAATSPRYDARAEATRSAKIMDDGGFWHRMGDLGYFDEQGRLWFCGRKSQRVVTALGTLYTIPVEGVFNAHPAVKRTALVGAGPEGMKVPVLCVELEDGADAASVTRELLALGARYEHTKRIATILFHPGFPVDIRHNAKIARETLAEWAERRVR